jgi:hypothetical protein
MSSRRRTPASEPDRLAKIDKVTGRLRAQREARREKVLRVWKERGGVVWDEEAQRFKSAPGEALSEQKLHQICLFFLADPAALILGGGGPSLLDDPGYAHSEIPPHGSCMLRPFFVYQLMQAYVARTTRCGQPEQEDIAAKVDDLVDLGASLKEARERVALAMTRTVGAVTRTHQRHGRRRRKGDK